MKIKLPSGVILEPETQQELSWLLAELGVNKSQKLSAESRVLPSTSGPSTEQWSPQQARTLIEGLSDAAKKLIKLLSERDMTTSQIAEIFGYPDNRPVGGLVNGIRRRCEAIGFEHPIDSDEINGQRVISLTRDFRRAVSAAKEAA